MVDLVGNVLLLQLGKNCTLMNVGLASLINKVLNYEAVEDVYGCLDGLYGLLSGNFIDLASQQQKNINNLLFTPGAALGSRVIDNEEIDYAKVVDVLQSHDIKFLFILGDESSLPYCIAIESAAANAGYEMRLMLIPFSASNSLPLTDHGLGYGSFAKSMAALFNDIITNARSIQSVGTVTVVEFSGCSNMWLLNSVALVRKMHEACVAPNLIFSNVFDEQILVKKVYECVHANGNCVIVVGSDLTNHTGGSIVGNRTPGEYVKFIVEANFDLDVDLVILHDWTHIPLTISTTDSNETVACAKRAVELAIDNGSSGKMMILLRTDSQKYSSEVSCVDIANAIGKRKEFPEAWYNGDKADVDVSFFKYLSPLVVGEVFPTYDAGVQSFAKLR